WDVIARRLTAAAEADLVLALYNPASSRRRHQLPAARELLLKHRPPETPLVIGGHVGVDAARVTVSSLGALDPERVDMRCLVIVCSSTTRVTGRGAVYTPRRYP